MKFSSLLYGLGALTPLAFASGYDPTELPATVQISIQPITRLGTPSSSPIQHLCTIAYNPTLLYHDLDNWSPPELPPSSKLVRVGVYKEKEGRWEGSVSTTSVESFSKGYSPKIVLFLNSEAEKGGEGEVLGVSVKSAKIDAGATRDFGPSVKLVKGKKGKGPELNRPVVLNEEGKLEEPEPEKTLLQRYVERTKGCG